METGIRGVIPEYLLSKFLKREDMEKIMVRE